MGHSECWRETVEQWGEGLPAALNALVRAALQGTPVLTHSDAPHGSGGLHKVRRKVANSNQKPRIPCRPTASHKRQVQKAGCDQQQVGASCWRKQGPVGLLFIFHLFFSVVFHGLLVLCSLCDAFSLPLPLPAVAPSHICPLRLHLAPSARMCGGQVGRSSHLPDFSALCHVASAPTDPQSLSVASPASRTLLCCH